MAAHSIDQLYAVVGALSALIATAAGAFGAHGLKRRLDASMLGVFEIGVRYQMYHSLALIAVAWAWTRWPGQALVWAGALFIAGIVVFSGSLYLLSLTGKRWLGAVTPLGGLALLAGWGCLAWAPLG